MSPRFQNSMQEIALLLHATRLSPRLGSCSDFWQHQVPCCLMRQLYSAAEAASRLIKYFYRHVHLIGLWPCSAKCRCDTELVGAGGPGSETFVAVASANLRLGCCCGCETAPLWIAAAPGSDPFAQACMSPGAKLLGIEAGNELKGELAGKLTRIGTLSPGGGAVGIGVEGSGAIAGMKVEEAIG